MLSPLGVLHDEIDRLLRQEMPTAIPLRPILDAIGLGAHKSSEIAGRLQLPATAITRQLRQLQELGYVRREVPFGEDEKHSKKSLYKLSDPFLRLWFKVVAPHRGALQSASKPARRRLLINVWSGLRGIAWEELCRKAAPCAAQAGGDWGPAGRYWKANAGEWDVVSVSSNRSTLLLGECKAFGRKVGQKAADRLIHGFMGREIPVLPGAEKMRKEYAVYVPDAEPGVLLPNGVHLVDETAAAPCLHPGTPPHAGLWVMAVGSSITVNTLADSLLIAGCFFAWATIGPKTEPSPCVVLQ